jgi:hypothetical protein
LQKGQVGQFILGGGRFVLAAGDLSWRRAICLGGGRFVLSAGDLSWRRVICLVGGDLSQARQVYTVNSFYIKTHIQLIFQFFIKDINLLFYYIYVIHSFFLHKHL